MKTIKEAKQQFDIIDDVKPNSLFKRF